MRKQVWEIGNNNIIGLKNVLNIFESKVRKPDYLTFEILEDGIVTFTSEANVLQWSFDNGATWVEGNEIEVKKGDNVKCKGECVLHHDDDGDPSGIGRFSTTCYYNLSGDVATLLKTEEESTEKLTEKLIIDNIYAAVCGMHTMDSGSSGEIFFQTTYPNLSKKERVVAYTLTSWEELLENLKTICTKTQESLLQEGYNFAILMEEFILMIPNYAELTPKEVFITYTKMYVPTATDLDGIGVGLCFTELSDNKLQCEYRSLFEKNDKLIDASKLTIIPISGNGCSNMFSNCTSLKYPPKLPATKLTYGCYNYMFYNCKSLTTAPELPATTLTHDCYFCMFGGCVSLRTAPALPATILKGWCYNRMFYNCISLNHIKMLATDISASNCLESWVCNVARIGTFIKHLNMNSLPIGDRGIPYGKWNIGIEIDYKRFSIINNSNNDEIIFNYNNGIYSLVKGKHIDLFKYTPPSFVPEINLNIDIYKVSQDNIGILKLTDIIWGSGASLEELCYAYDINDLEGILIIIKSINDNYNGGYYDYYNDDYYDSPEIGMHVYYSKDNGNTWIGDIYSYGESFTIDVNQGDTIMFKASRDGNDINTSKNVGGYLTFNIKSKGRIKWTADDNSGTFSNSTASFDVSGNIMSLVYGDNFEDKNQLNTNYIFNGIFSKTLVVNAENLILPATILTEGCYSGMFAECTSLTTAPELPATTLAENCYGSMFRGCTSLVTAPELPATKLICSCYSSMFYGCTSLNHIKMLATDISAYRCLDQWVSGVTNNGIFVKHSDMNSLPTGENGIPEGWDVQDASI